jgi:hypothetical protein
VTTFEDGGSKALSGTDFNIRGHVEGDGNVALDLRNGATVTLETMGTWNQAGAGSFTQGVGDPGRFDVLGTFTKTGAGTFEVRSGLACAGTMDLREGVVEARGDFSLFDTGVITGGSDGSGEAGENLRLRVLNATSAVVRGTIEPDLDGEPAMFQIQGIMDLESTATIKLDVAFDGPFNSEYVDFVTSGQPFGGTLELNVLRPVDPGVDYVFIRSFGSQGEFTVEGDAQFDEVVQESTGVIGRQFTR